MTYEQIIEALECCNGYDCETCMALKYCDYMHPGALARSSLDIINSQKAEIERLNIELKAMRGAANSYKAEIERLKDKIFVLENDLEKAENLSDALGNDVDIKLNHIYDLEENLKKAKSEAIKECLEKVKNYIKTHCNPYGKPDFDYDTSIKILNFIDNLVKEITEEKEK